MVHPKGAYNSFFDEAFQCGAEICKSKGGTKVGHCCNKLCMTDHFWFIFMFLLPLLAYHLGFETSNVW